MRVLQLVPSADSNAYRGQIRALRDRGIECRTLAVPGSHVPGERARSPLEYLVHLVRTRRVAREPYDLVHANQGVVAPAALATGLPTVVSLWGTDLYGRIGPVSRRCADRADAAVVMSERMADDLGPIDARVVPHGVDTETFRPADRRAARDRLDWDDERAHVLFPYDPARPVKDFPRARRVVEGAAGRLGGEVVLHVVTTAPHAEMPTYLNAADALVLTSTHEGSPNAVKEALAVGLPVVATPVGDVPELLDGVTPSTVAETDEGLADGLATALAHSERSNGREQVRHLTRARTARELERVYRTVVADA